MREILGIFFFKVYIYFVFREVLYKERIIIVG